MDALSVASGAWLGEGLRRALAAMFLGVAVLVMGGLQGCGGGGGGAAPSPPPVPAPSPSPVGPIAAQVSVPAPVGYDAERLAAFDRLNEIRRTAGLGMLAQSSLLDQAAQAHAAWIVANDSFTHEETAGTAGFTGVDWWNRDEALGYVPVEGEEVMSAPVRGAAGVDGLVNTLYHRAGMLAFAPVDVGIGWSSLAAGSVSMPLVIDITRPGNDAVRGLGQQAQPAIDGVSIWPIADATGVPLRLGLESPNPVPTQDVLTLGTPASVTVDEETTLTVDSFVMTDVATGDAVQGRVLTNANDPNLLLPRSFAAFVPLNVLAPHAVYRVDFSGSGVGFISGVRRVVQRTWSFTTAGD